MQNAEQLLKMMLQSNPQIRKNPILQNAFDMQSKGDLKGLQQLADNLCREKGTSVEEMKKILASKFNI